MTEHAPCRGSGGVPTRRSETVRIAIEFGDCPHCGGTFRVDEHGMLVRHRPSPDVPASAE
jgi:hypothetical protein